MSALPHTQSSVQPKELLAVLQQQSELVEQLACLASDQTALIAEGRTDRLLDLLAKRQSVIDAFTDSQNRLGDLAQGLDQGLANISAAERAQMKALIADIGERLTQVMQRDEADQANLRLGRDQVKKELASLATSKQAHGAYRGSSEKTARFSDQRG